MKSAPKKLRTGRYSLYIGKPSKYRGSNTKGIYGLLDGFTVYCWGCTAMLSLHQYCMVSEDQNPDMWSGRFGSAFSSSHAFVEFRYFIEHYLVYTKKHYPRVYAGIMKNKQFKKAIKKVDCKFAKTVKAQDAKHEKRHLR